ncbi:MAG: recombinase family protein [Lachnospiraceae bacterium]|nr:recombinase family protein [Lachnospiraceae bacterium]
MKKCIATYLRLSLEDVDKRTNKEKDESNSINAQRQMIQRHIADNPYLSGLPQMEFCDDGFSGTNFDRPGFQEMIDLIRDGEISCVIVKDLSRFGRDYLEVGDYLEHIFPFLGIRIISLNDHYDSEDFKGNTPGMDIAFKNLIYGYYSKDLSKKVKSAMRLKQTNGGFVTCCLYGYKVLPDKKHKMVIDPETAPVVRRVYMDMIAGKIPPQIAKELNAEGVPTPLEYKKITRKGAAGKPIWTHHRIIDMIKNMKYTGCMVNHTRESRKIRDKAQRRVPKEEWIIHENAHEAIVTMEEFEEANAMLNKPKGYKRKKPKGQPPFYCSHCGRKLQRTFGNDVHYYCTTSYHAEDAEECKKVRWDKEDLEQVLLEALKAQLSVMEVNAKENSKGTVSKGTQLLQQIQTLTEELENEDSQKVQNYLDYREGRISKEEFLSRREIKENRHREMKETISKLETEYEEFKKSDSQAKKDRAVVKQASSMDDDALKEMMYDAIEKVNISDSENIEIIWKFDDLFSVA